jgi:hypothetical protein
MPIKYLARRQIKERAPDGNNRGNRYVSETMTIKNIRPSLSAQ